MTHSPPPTPEQQAILCATGNLMIRAYAGCGKTATLHMLEQTLPGPVLFLAFNRKIAEDAKKKMSASTIVKTFNGLGHSTWADTIGKKLSLNPKKTADQVREALKGMSRVDAADLWPEYRNICDAVDMCKTLGYIPQTNANCKRSLCNIAQVASRLDEKLSGAAEDLVLEVLAASIKLAYLGTIDFADQIYMPTLFTGTFPKFPTIMVDEYQDLNPLNHAIIRKLARHGRLIGVGDPYQNIYGFRGACAHGMADAVVAHGMKELPLSVSFRCPENIVKGVHWHVPEMRWSRGGGSRTILVRPRLGDIADHSVVICRNNAPLFALAMRLLAAGRSVSLAGSDVGPKVIAILKKLGDESTPRADLLALIDSWRDDKVERGSVSAPDTAECMKVFASYGETLREALIYANHLFEQEGSIEMYTIHKAKGLEWERVYHLDPWLVHKDEPNLRYVCETRTSDQYYEIDSRRIEG